MTTLSTPSLPAVGRAGIGFVALGLAAALADPWVYGMNLGPSGLMVSLGALALTGPSLLVAHPFLGLEAKPDALVAVLATTFVGAGELALGLTPLVLFFTATTDLGPVVFTALLILIGATALLGAARDLVAVEGSPERQLRMRGLAAAWCALTVLGAVRIGWEVMA